MRQSQLFTKTLRTPPTGEVSHNARLLIQAGFADKLMAGVYSYLPLGLRVLKKIENIIREEMNVLGGQEVLMPALHPLENYEATNRQKIDVLFHVESQTGKKMVLGQSHEEVVVPLLKAQVHSYKNFPVAVYQIQTKFRNELRAKSGVLRGVEFIMKDLYSFHTSEEDFEAFYKQAQESYMTIFKRAGIGDQTFITFASGGTFSKYSHEFQTLTEAGEDTIHLCEKCGVAVNDEIIGELGKCPTCGNKKLIVKKSIEVGNIFPLKSKFSDAFGMVYGDAKGQHHPVTMGCYGIGLTRLLGTIVETHSDEKGIIWPESVAPFRVHMIQVDSRQPKVTSKIQKASEDLYKKLTKAGIEVLFDDRDKSPGEKFADADLIGIPWRVVVSEKTLAKKGVEVKKRSAQKAQVMSVAALMKKLKIKKSK